LRYAGETEKEDRDEGKETGLHRLWILVAGRQLNVARDDCSARRERA
jgi:hypothetical protein